MKINNEAKELPEANYEGYIWMSDSTHPEIYDGKPFDNELLAAGKNPFVIEGYLYNKEKRLSYSIKYVDGAINLVEFVLDSEDLEHNAQKPFYGNRMDGRKLWFLDVWEAAEDEFCLGMKVLQPKAKVFVGFNKQEK